MKKKSIIPVGRRGTINCLALSCFLPAVAYSQTTGWNKADAGPYNYNDSANWVGGAINGTWDSSLALTAAQTTTFGGNTPLSTGLTFNYDGGFNETLRADGTGPYAVTLGGNIIVDTTSTNRTVTFGSTTANQGLNVDLGGQIRTFSVGGVAASNATRSLTFSNNVTNGGLNLQGGGVVNLNGNTNTLGSLRIRNNAFRLSGTSGANSATTVSGALTIDGAAAGVASNTDHFGGIATVTLTPNAARNLALSASSLVRENKGVVFFRGNSLGGTLGANGVSNITFTSAPALVGGGGATGTTNISILSEAMGGTTAASNANSFVTYDPVNGIRPLDIATEYVSYADGYNGAVTGSDNNSRIASGATVNFTGANTVNSLFVGDASGGTLTGDGVLTVTSGAVFLQGAGSSIAASLNFGLREGVIGCIQGQNSTINGSMAGSGGVTVYQAQSNTSTFGTGTAITFSGASAFTGSFTVNSRATVSHSDFLPYGSRTGNTVVNGLLTLSGTGTDTRYYTMNGLDGNGRLSKGFSGNGLFRIGDNNSNGNFTGTITDGGSTTLEKIGSGTQVFSGANAYNNVTRILGGTLEVTLLADGTQNSGIGKSPNGATFLALNGGTLKYSGAATSTDRLFTVGTSGGGLDSSGSGALTLTNTGSNVSGEAAGRVGVRTDGSSLVTGVTSFTDLTVGARVTGTGIPAGTTIVSLNPTAGEFTLSANSTANSSSLMSFSTDRVFTLAGSNTGSNMISGPLANSSTAGKLSVRKQGGGTWTLDGANTYGGNTEVQAGTLVLGEVNPSNEASEVRLASSSTLTLDFAGDDTVDKLFINGVQQPSGFYKASGNANPGTILTQLSGTGRLFVTSGPASVPGYSDWATLNGASTNPSDDHDNDGVRNGVEYFMAGSGANTTGFTANPPLVVSGGTRTVTWPKDPGYLGTYRVEISDGLSIWTDVTNTGSVANNPTSVVYTFPAPAGKLFVRLVVTPQ